MSNELPISVEKLLEQCGGNRGIAEMILNEFLIQVPADTADMEAYLTKGDLLAMSKTAHRLKGTAATLGASQLYPLCASLELAGKQENTEESAKIFPELKAEAQRCIDSVPLAKAVL